MARGALIIEYGSSPLGTTPDLGGELAVCRRRQWGTFLSHELIVGDENLLVANAVPWSAAAVQFFQWLRQHPIGVPTLAILPGENSDLLQIATEVVDDFLLSPVRGEELQRRVARLVGRPSATVEAASASLIAELSLQQMVGKDPNFLRVLAEAGSFAAGDAPVLLTGETGTGKELCARIVHWMSKRRQGPFIPVECGALPEHLFENELFGHARGAFTDAHTDQNGLVALAEGGTLFLDEVDGFSPAIQGKVLRLLQERTYRPLGSEHFRSTNVRIIAATNSNLEKLVCEKHFREDLFYRLNVLRVHLPPLRQRPGDVALLARHFVEEICSTEGMPRKVFSPASIRKLEEHDWPGNVRELYNTVQRAAFAAPGTQIASAHINFSRFQSVGESPSTNQAEDFRSAKSVAIQKFERGYVERLLEKYAGNVTQAAREAGKDRRAFGRLVKKYGVRQAS
ncbi:MAG TPA: sigma-54 dependent transcriptional regulator [Candidatus Sulfotelmatobacter sp.]|nr:sigma-54 dependent transcriptional regulator [Candidatus Sulfotelmatobacter sp.]